MTIYTALFEEMRDDAAIAAIVGTSDPRIYPGINPPDATAPFISFAEIAYIRINTLAGPTNLVKPTFQIDCWGSDNEEMVTLSRAVRALLDGFRGNMGDVAVVVRRADLTNKNDDPEDPTNAGPNKINRQRMDFDIWHID